MKRRLTSKLAAIIGSYSEIFFLQGLVPGLCLLGISFLNPSIGIAGLLAVVTAYCFARCIGYQQAFLSSGFYIYNPLLIGFSIGASFKLNITTCVLLAISSILSFIITLTLSHIFSKYLGLQILSIPFIIVSSLVYLASGTYSYLYITSLYTESPLAFIPLPIWAEGFLKALGGIIFMPNTLAGILIASLLLYASRILFSLALLGFLAGGLLHSLFIGSLDKSFLDHNSFNYCLIAMALGGIYLIPSLSSYLLALVGVAMSTVIISAVNIFWAQYGIPIFTLPFAGITLSMVYIFKITAFKWQPLVFRQTPEETREHALTYQDRYPSQITLSLPFQNTWTVWQGFQGPWTHQGPGEYAYDFVITENQKTYTENGTRLEHYYCYRKEVFSPVYGTVVKVINHIPDGVIGSVNIENKWGNYITLYDPRGVYVTLAHFSPNSICVYEGEWVNVSTYLGLCGNSGYSPQPHLHLQAHYFPDPQSATIPFQFVRYIRNNHYTAWGLPEVETAITAAPFQPYYDQITTYLLESIYRFEVSHPHKKTRIVEFKVGMAPDATFYFASPKAKLYFGKLNGTFYMYHLEGRDPDLAKLYMACPQMPLYGDPSLTWTDVLPPYLVLNSWQTLLASFFSFVFPRTNKVIGRYQFHSFNDVKGEITHAFFKKKHYTEIFLDPQLHIQGFKVDQYYFKRI